MQEIRTAFDALRHGTHRYWIALGLVLLLTACGGDGDSADSGDSVGGSEQVGDGVADLLVEAATVTRCEMDVEGGFPVMEVELTNPLDEQTQNIFVYVDVLDSSGETLDSATAVFENLAPGATGTAPTGAFNFPEDSELGSCVPAGGATS